jgi:nitrate/TMAO reductase-like tetraheme cytochrome c subunit
MEKVTISKETLQKLLDNFYEACALCDEMDIYEFEEGDESMQEMKEWADKKFGRKIDKPNYE